MSVKPLIILSLTNLAEVLTSPRLGRHHHHHHHQDHHHPRREATRRGTDEATTFSTVAFDSILQGIRILDMTQYLSGPTVTRLLAELGAEVVKIEQAPHGDPTRTLAVLRDGRSGYFVQQNRGKRSVCLDFDRPDGRRVIDSLLARADVFVEN